MLTAQSPARGTPCCRCLGLQFCILHSAFCPVHSAEYLIPFAPLAFAPQRQKRSSAPLSPPVFLPISTHFTAPPEVPHAPTSLETASIKGTSAVEPRAFTPDLAVRLRAL